MANFSSSVKSCMASGIGRVMYVSKEGSADKPQLKVLFSCNCKTNKKEEKYVNQSFGVVLFGTQARNAVEYGLLVRGNYINFVGDIEGVYVNQGSGQPPVINLNPFTFNYSVVAYSEDTEEQPEQMEEPPAVVTKTARTKDIEF